jgi:hypothetical protein
MFGLTLGTFVSLKSSMPNRICRVLAVSIAAMLASGVEAQAPAASLPEKPSAAAAGQALALADLSAMESHIREHTPIPFDADNEAARLWLVEGFQRAKARVAKVVNEADWYYTLASFANGFRDPHLNVAPTGDLPAAKWPGFVVAAVQTESGMNAVVVARDEADNSVPRVGDVITACDNEGLVTLANTRVFPYVLNPALPTDRRRAVSRLFVYRETSFETALGRCEVQSAAAVEPQPKRSITLQWREVPRDKSANAAWWSRFNNINMGPTPAFGVSEPLPGVTWISVPTFQSGGDAAPKLEALLEEVGRRGVEMRRGRAIVIDTRGNGGGNSAWATKLAEAIFTAEILRKYRAPAVEAAGVDWRASEGNVAYWLGWEQKMAREFGAFSGSRLFAQYVAKRMQDAIDEGKVFYREGSGKTGLSGGATLTRPPRDAIGPFPAKVYFLSNGSCGSSCLNFADQVLFVPGVKLVGSATSGDGMLMDVRSEVLPSGLARLTFPQKVARGRGRGNLEVYQPDIPYGGIWEDAVVRAWVLSMIQP